MQVTWRKIYPCLFIILAILLQSCAKAPVKDVTVETPKEIDPIVTIQNLMGEGDYTSAAKAYYELAQEAPAEQQVQLLLNSADAWFLADNSDEAAATLALLASTRLEPDQALHYRLLLTEMSLKQGQAESALDMLEPPPTTERDLALRQRYHRVKAEAFRLAGNIMESARQYILLSPLLSEAEQQTDNQLAIVTTLTTLTDTALELLRPDPPGELGAWMELARIIKTQDTDPDAFPTRLAIWQEANPEHRISPELLERYQARAIDKHLKTDHIAVLLPRSGPYAKVATALRDGLLAAYYNQPQESRPQLRFYDSSDPNAIRSLYRQAVDNGANMLLGPLNKEAVTRLLHSAGLEIPILALNSVNIDVKPPRTLFQFSLSPEDEARQVAERAWLDGHNRALALSPSGSWGERIMTSFRDHWQRLGGTLAEQQFYDPNGNDFSAPIRALLNIDQSNSRQRQLEDLLGEKVKYEARRREDVDFIFLAARSQKGRQLRPQLQFHHAGSLPLYSTSHIFSGTLDRAKDKDLGRLLFPDIPWVLEKDDNGPLSRMQLTNELDTFEDKYARFYAMGIDSYLLLPHLLRLQENPGETLSGKTGTLYIDPQNQIHRQLVWASMRHGRPRIVGYAPRIEPATTGDLQEESVNREDFDSKMETGHPQPPTPEVTTDETQSI